MDFTAGDKASILLQLLDHQLKEIERREGREQKIFEWSTGLLLAAFAATVALSNRGHPLEYSYFVKAVATILVATPCLIFSYRFKRYSDLSVENAKAVERIEQCLGVYKGASYGGLSPYPPEWEGVFAENRKKRHTPYVYLAVLILMELCVIATIWLIL
jgi:hypothetical protein